MFNGVGTMLIIFCIETIIVMMAMTADFISGIHKAKLNGEVRSSYGFKRTISKFILYIGSLCIACGIDAIFFVSQLWELVGLGLLTKIPIVCTLIAVFACVIEIRSLWEKAENKQRKNAGDTLDLLLSIAGDKPTLIKWFTESVAKAGKEDNNDKNRRHEKM